MSKAAVGCSVHTSGAKKELHSFQTQSLPQGSRSPPPGVSTITVLACSMLARSGVPQLLGSGAQRVAKGHHSFIRMGNTFHEYRN